MGVWLNNLLYDSHEKVVLFKKCKNESSPRAPWLNGLTKCIVISFISFGHLMSILDQNKMLMMTTGRDGRGKGTGMGIY